MSLEGRVALVTGGGRGVGRAVSLGLAEDGAAVAVNYRHDARAAEATVAEIEARGGTARVHRASIGSREETEAMVEEVLAELGPVDLLVNNAGVASRGRSVRSTDPGEFERLLGVHAVGAAWLCQLLIPSMRERPRGDILFVSSVATEHMAGWGAPYNMGKAAQEALAMTLAKEEERNGIRVNVVAPGLVDTEMGRRLARAVAGVDDIHELDPSMPLGRVCTPDDVANVVRFLVSDAGSMVTGARVKLGGGARGD